MIEIIIIDSHEVWRNYLHVNLSVQKDFRVLGCGSDNYDALKLMDTHRPDIALLGFDSLTAELVSLFKARYPGTSLVVFSAPKDNNEIFEALFCGLSGYIDKKENLELICSSIRTVYHGGLVTSGLAKLKKLMEERNTWLKGKQRFDRRTLPKTVSPAEIKIMSFVGQGLSNKEIAERLMLREGTIRNYISSVLQKTGLHDRTQIAIYALKAGIVIGC